jgi:hypothetical protein
MYVRLAFWTLSLAYTAALFSATSTTLTAALLGAMLGFGFGGMLINRRTRKRG